MATPPVRRAARRWRTPPVLLRGGQIVEGLAMLDEFAGPLAALLFQLRRDVDLWGATPPKKRAGLFVARAGRTLNAMLRAAGVPPQLKPALRTLVRIAEAPEAAQNEQVALACSDVAHWAEQEGRSATAIEFAQAAAVLTPADASRSLAVGRLTWRHGEGSRAETWFRRTLHLARQSRDRATHAQAYQDLLNLYRGRGNRRAVRYLAGRRVRPGSTS